MTRKEQILKAARDYVSGVTLSSPSDVIHFEYGARWADEHPKNAWHPSSEKPKDRSNILVRYTYLGCVELKSYRINYNHLPSWFEFVDFNEIEEWAYVGDILPKGGEQ